MLIMRKLTYLGLMVCFVISILSLKYWFQPFWCPVAYIVGGLSVLLGIIILIRRENGNKKTKGRKRVIFVLILLVLWLSVGYPVLQGMGNAIRSGDCGGRMRELVYGLMLYENDHDGYLPDSHDWCDQILPYLPSSDVRVWLLSGNLETNPEILFQCSGDMTGPCSYAINKAVAGKKSSELPRNTVILFESKPGWNQSGGISDVDFRHTVSGKKVSHVSLDNSGIVSLTQEELGNNKTRHGPIQW